MLWTHLKKECVQKGGRGYNRLQKYPLLLKCLWHPCPLSPCIEIELVPCFGQQNTVEVMVCHFQAWASALPLGPLPCEQAQASLLEENHVAQFHALPQLPASQLPSTWVRSLQTHQPPATLPVDTEVRANFVKTGWALPTSAEPPSWPINSWALINVGCFNLLSLSTVVMQQ